MLVNNYSTTVCIITNNRPFVLKSCLESIANQTYYPDEVIIIDSSDSIDVNALIRESYRDYKYIYNKLDLGSQPLLRNIGLMHCKTDIICFIDDDAFPFPDWLEKIVYAFNTYDNIGSVGGRIIQGIDLFPQNLKQAIQLTGRYNNFKWAFGSFNVDFESCFLIDSLQGTNMCFRTNVIRSIGGFDSKLAHGYASFEDTDLCLTLNRNGFVNVYVPNAIVVHGLEPRAKGYSRDIGIDKNFAFSFARNGSYVHLKNSKFILIGFLSLFTTVILINSVRIFLPIINNKRRVDFFNIKRIQSFISFLQGLINGIKLYYE